jgi:HEAT repeat protein
MVRHVRYSQTSCSALVVESFDPSLTKAMTTNSLTFEQALTKLATVQTSAERIAVMQIVANAQDVRGIEPMICALSYNDAGLFEVVVSGLIAIGEPSVQPILDVIDRMDYGARYQAFRALVGIGDPRPRNSYAYWLKADIAPSVRRICVKGLGQFDDSLDLLLDALKDADWSVRYCAVGVLGERQHLTGIRTTLEALKDDSERTVRLKLAQVLQA